MNHTKQTFVARLMMLAALICTSLGISAQNKFHIEPFAIDSYDEVTVPVLLDLEDAAAQAFQFDVVLPPELEFSKNPEKAAERLTPGHSLSFQNGRVMVISGNMKPISGSEGAVVNLYVKVREGRLTDKNIRIELTNPTLTKPGEGKFDTAVKLDVEAEGTDVSMHQSQIWAYLPDSELTVNPGGTTSVAVAINNNFDVRGFQFSVTLPEGFTASDEVIKSERCNEQMTLMVIPTGNEVCFTATAMNTLPVIFDNDGTVITFNVTAPVDFKAESAEIKLHSATFSTDNALVIEPMPGKETSTVTLINGVTAYGKAMTEISALETALAEARVTITEVAPDVKDDFIGAEITEKINDLKAAVEAAYADMTLTGNYDEVMAPVEAIKAGIEKLVEDAKAAQKVFEDQNALDKAYADAKASLNELETALAEALATIAEVAPDVKDDFTGEEITEKINDLKAAVEAAYADMTLTGNYDEVMAPVEAIKAETEKLVEDAKAAQKVFENEAALYQAYSDAKARVKELETALADALAKIADEAADVKNDFTGNNISADITALRTDILESYTDKTLVENYQAITEKADKIQAAIETLVADALAAQLAFEVEKARQESNAAAYAADIEIIEALVSKLEDALAKLKETYPDFDSTDIESEIRDAIQAEREKATAALDAVKEEGEYDNKVDSTSIEDMIEKMFEQAGIDSITVDNLTGDAKYYDLSGHKLSGPVAGSVTIIVYPDGSTRKVFVK